MKMFVREISTLADMHLYRAAAETAREMGYSFEEAYRIIFGKWPA